MIYIYKGKREEKIKNKKRLFTAVNSRLQAVEPARARYKELDRECVKERRETGDR